MPPRRKQVFLESADRRHADAQDNFLGLGAFAVARDAGKL